MPSYVDSAFLNAVQNVRPYDYWQDFNRGYQLFQESPWSYRNRRKEQLENYQLAMQQQRFAADMAERARQAKLDEMMAPYKIDLLRQQAESYGRRWQQAPQQGSAYENYLMELDAVDTPQPDLNQPVADLPIVDDQIPLPVNRPGPVPDINQIPDLLPTM